MAAKRQTLFLLVVITLSASIPESVGQCDTQHDCSKCQCPNGWTYFQNSCYLFSDTTNLDWVEATHHCGSHHASLVTIGSKEEDLFIKDFCERLFKKDRAYNDSFWAGATDRDIEGIWTWYTDNTSLDYTNWYPGEPSGDHHTEDCLCLYTSFNFIWNDCSCAYKLHPICEIRMDADQIPEIIG